MKHADHRGCAISGATPRALVHFEHALAASLSWRTGTDERLETALQDAPEFVAASVLQAYQRVCSRDPLRARSARPIVARAARLPANERERLHLAAIGAALADDHDGATARLDALLRLYPRDVLALQAAQAFDHATGNARRMRDRVERVLPAWSRDLPGYHAVLAMQAFGLVECGEYERAEDAALAALALNPLDARAHHVMAHLFEMTDRAGAGERWMSEHRHGWDGDSVVARHCRWHLSLFQLAQGRTDRALQAYDAHLRADRSIEVADLIDASSLLWRIRLQGRDGGTRWPELAEAWSAHVDDAFCTFNDVHAMLAFVGAGDWARAHRLERALLASRSRPTRYGLTTRQLGLPACRALIAFGRGDHGGAIEGLASLPAIAHRLGGSHAQRDVLHLTLVQSIERLRRPGARPAINHDTPRGGHHVRRVHPHLAGTAFRSMGAAPMR